MSMESLAGCSPQGNLTQSGPGCLPFYQTPSPGTKNKTTSCLRRPLLLHFPSFLIPAIFLPIDTKGLFAFQQTQRKSHHLMFSLSFPRIEVPFFPVIFLPLSHLFPTPVPFAVCCSYLQQPHKLSNPFPSLISRS